MFTQWKKADIINSTEEKKRRCHDGTGYKNNDNR